MLKIWLPEKMLRYLRNSKGSKELSATSMEILVSGVDQECFWTLCFHTAYQSLWPGYKITQCQCFIPPPVHTSCWANCHTSAYTTPESAFRQSVLSQIPSLSPLALWQHTKINTDFLFEEWPLKLVFAPSLSSTRRTIALWGN